MKNEITNIKASVRARLQNKARETGKPFAEILQYYGMERFLYRFSCSEYVNKFILKGALMFTVWDIMERRSTMDIDFAANYDNRVKAVEKVIKDVCRVSIADDGLEFDTHAVRGQKIKEDADYEGIRIKFTGFLGRAKIPMQIDMAFGDRIYPNPMTIEYPVILDMPIPNLKGYPAESVVSEKFEAMVKLGSLNSRMKDFYDIWLLMRSFDFNGTKLARALKRTFEYRKTLFPEKTLLFDEGIYDEKSDRQELWKAFLKKNDIKNVPDKLNTIARQIDGFLREPIEALERSQKFDKCWSARGFWK